MSEKPYRTIAGICLLWAFTSVAIAGSFTPAAGTTLSSTSVTVAWQSDAVQQWVRAYISSGDKIFDSGRQSSSTGQANFAIAPSVTQLRIVFYEKTSGGSWRPNDRTYTVNIDATGGGTTDINQENYKSILALAARLTTNTFADGIRNFVAFAIKDSGTSDRENYFSIPPFVRSVVKECPLSGKVTIVEGPFLFYNDTYNECATPMSTINGTIVDDTDTSAAYIDVDLVFEDIEFNRFSPNSRIGNVVVRGNLSDLCTECTGNGEYTLHEYREEAAGNISLSLTGSGGAGGTVLGVDADPFAADISLFSGASYRVSLSGYPGINTSTEPLVLDMEIKLDVEGFGVPGSLLEVVASDGSKVLARFQSLVGRPEVRIKDNSGNTTYNTTLNWFEIFPYPLERAAEP